ncbi:MAG: tetratricopeptide repeat protein [Bacteroidota bacterium]|jgi:tetratricopeptide (TPR) repeat protein|nr:tetratricopeptide repeat protein [Bacteroidota bacterium]
MFDDIAALERHLAAHPASPLFARLASLYIEGDRPAQALKLCLQGLRRHPDYPTGLLMTARAQIMLRQYTDARQTLQLLLRILPSSGAARQLLTRMTELELEYPPYAASAGAAVARQDMARTSVPDRRQQWSHQDDILPGIERFAPTRLKSDDLVPTETDRRDTAVLDIAALALRLEGAKIPSLPAESEIIEEAGGDGTIEAVDLESRPVTETLISIYEQQGRLLEALDGYERLRELFPDRQEHFDEKVRALQQRIQREQSQ